MPKVSSNMENLGLLLCLYMEEIITSIKCTTLISEPGIHDIWVLGSGVLIELSL